MQRGAPSLNPHGRPKVGQSLADAYRSKWTPERIVEHVSRLAESAVSEQVRLAALAMINERTAGKVSDRLELSRGADAEQDEDALVEALSDAELDALDRLDDERSRIMGAARDRHVIDVPSEDQRSLKP